jgi:hypothetical protein
MTMKKTNSKSTKKSKFPVPETISPFDLVTHIEVDGVARPLTPKRGRKAIQPGTPPADLPDWAKRAAARDTANEMAAVPEAAPTPPATPETLPPKKGRAPKAATPARKKAAPTETPAAIPGSLRAIGNGWLDALRDAGHTPSTLSSYANDLEVAYEHFGETKVAAEITEKEIAAFNASRGVVKTRAGKSKAQPTILKTRRALRLALVWAEQTKLIKKAPFPAKTPA